MPLHLVHYIIAGSLLLIEAFSPGTFLFVCFDDQSMLLVKRSKHSSEPGTWSSIGGAIEPGETALQAAEREVVEEVGSMLPIKKMVAELEYKNDGISYITFIANVDLEDKMRWSPKLNEENDEIKWFRGSEMPKKLHPNMKKTLDDYMNSL